MNLENDLTINAKEFCSNLPLNYCVYTAEMNTLSVNEGWWMNNDSLWDEETFSVRKQTLKYKIYQGSHSWKISIFKINIEKKIHKSETLCC
jgi:hypothetical protein